MNDLSFPAQRQQFADFLLILSLLLGFAACSLILSHGWHAGFMSGQAVSRVLPPVFWEMLATLGDERVLLALLLPFCLRYPRVFWAIVVASLTAALLCRGLKIIFAMPRPAAVLDASEITIIGASLRHHSFPSGHTASAFAFAAVWVAQLGWRRALPIVGLAVLAGFSRVAVGAHWPLDVLAGAALGTLAAWAGVVWTRHFRWGLRVGVHWGMVLVATLAVCSLPFDGQGYPGSLPWRLAACIWGLAGFYWYYLRPLLRGGWRVASRPTVLVWRTAAKA
jgi:membrane-associated phospholipid phosphatase